MVLNVRQVIIDLAMLKEGYIMIARSPNINILFELAMEPLEPGQQKPALSVLIAFLMSSLDFFGQIDDELKALVKETISG